MRALVRIDHVSVIQGIQPGSLPQKVFINFSVDQFEFMMSFRTIDANANKQAIEQALRFVFPSVAYEVGFDRMENIRAGTYGNPRVKPPLSHSAARALPSAIEYCLRYFQGLYPANDGFYFTPATAKLNQRYFQLSAPVAKRLGFKVISNYKPGVFRGTYYVFIRI